MRIALILLLAVVALVATWRRPIDAEPPMIVMFHTMYGVDGPFVGDANPIRGIPGDDLPWEVQGVVTGNLTTSGRLHVLIHGLVFKDTDEVPEEMRGINDEPDFRGVVSCLTESGDAVTTVNVATEGFRATRTGNALIDAKVELPNPCVAPVVFVTGDDPSKWFAVTGVETEEGE